MKVSYDEGLASHIGPESCGGVREGVVEALTGERAGWVLSSEILIVREADALMSCGRLHRAKRQRELRTVPAESKTPGTRRSTSRGWSRTAASSHLRGGPARRDGSREISGSTRAVA